MSHPQRTMFIITPSEPQSVVVKTRRCGMSITTLILDRCVLYLSRRRASFAEVVIGSYLSFLSMLVSHSCLHAYPSQVTVQSPLYNSTVYVPVQLKNVIQYT
jgi:hypothetical protein